MRALVIDRYGEPDEVLRLVETDTPQPGPGEVRVRMRLSPVNPSDFNTIRGTYEQSLARAIWNRGGGPLHFDPERTRPLGGLPVSPGADGMGVVEAAGGGWYARRLVGRRVIVMGAPSGNWREQVVLPAVQAMPVPAGVSDEQAAMFLVNPMTAWAMVTRVLKVPRGAWLLQSGGGSQLARMVIRLGHRRGFRTISLVRRAGVAAELEALGADAVVDASREDVIARVASLTGNAGDAALPRAGCAPAVLRLPRRRHAALPRARPDAGGGTRRRLPAAAVDRRARVGDAAARSAHGGQADRRGHARLRGRHHLPDGGAHGGAAREHQARTRRQGAAALRVGPNAFGHQVSG